MRWPVALFAAIGLVLSAAPGAAAGPLGAARTNAEIFSADTRDRHVLAVRAYVWGYPLVRAAQLRQNATGGSSRGGVATEVKRLPLR